MSLLLLVPTLVFAVLYVATMRQLNRSQRLTDRALATGEQWKALAERNLQTAESALRLYKPTD